MSNEAYKEDGTIPSDKDTNEETTQNTSDAPEQTDEAQDAPSGEAQNAPISDDMPEAASGDTAELEARIAQLEVELAESQDKMLRAVAEAENTRRRGEKERTDTAKYAVSGFAKNLLSVTDNLRRAVEAVPAELRSENDQIENLLVGVEATERELLRAFDGAGIKPIDALDKPFDPNFHEVMFEAEFEDKPAGIVFQVLETGYMIHDRLLRPARVGVTKGNNAPKAVDKEV